MTALLTDPVQGLVKPAWGRVYLHPGEFAVAAEPVSMTTILGSCVGVCLYDPAARVGGLNHFLLPRSPAGTRSARFGDAAVQCLLRGVTRLGAEVRRLRAKVIGGACVLDAYRGAPAHVGRQNVRVALEMLAEAGIPVLTMDVEGDRARRVLFHSHTGDVVVRVL